VVYYAAVPSVATRPVPHWPILHVVGYISPAEMLHFSLIVSHIPHILFVYSVSECCRKFVFYGDLTAYTSE